MKDPFLRFSRQLNLEGFGKEKQRLLSESRVFIGGIGGIGGTTAIYLVCAGVKNLKLCHFGELELPDLNRQILMREKKLGSPRVEIAQETLINFCEDLNIEIFKERIDDETVDLMLKDCDLAISARPNFYERLSIAKACLKHNIPMIDGAMYDMFGHVFTMIPYKTACYGCLFEKLPDNWKELDFPVLGAFSGMIGTILAIETIKVLTNWHEPITGELLVVNGITYEINKIKIKKREKCILCG
ncbi:MAG: HesA/MoeB/ThiF family protein, partial [Proteobacteria bacterium]|nr:HesA/MoeB/ThiF family protein [Pseudomonadota bacterium]